eukprot:gene9363-12522_t
MSENWAFNVIELDGLEASTSVDQDMDDWNKMSRTVTDLDGESKDMMVENDERKRQWLEHIDSIDIKTEIAALQDETSAHFRAMESDLQTAYNTSMDKFEKAAASVLKSLASKPAQPDVGFDSTDAVDRLKEEITKQRDMMKTYFEEEKRILHSEDEQMADMLQYASAWGPQIDKRSELSSLQNRGLAGLQVTST